MAFFFKHNKKLKNGTGLQQKLYSQPFESTESGYISKETSYPWYRQKIFGPCPFPRYGHASNSMVNKTGDIYIFGGLVKEKVKHDLWVIDSATMMSYQIQTPGECPSSRVGHAGLVIGNAFIVFGGDTKTSKNNVNDNSLYLLNTTSKIWTKAVVYGNKPPGRYGHTLNVLGTKIIIFGGQMETCFFNDMFSFDLDSLNSLNAKWELITPVTNLPSARTNHIMITYQEKLYLFGGTNGNEWFNDVWVFDYKNLSWKEIACNGCIPQPREGHSAALVDDIIYIFGGRGLDGSDLGDLIAFKISTSRWYIFQNMGPSPSPRSGHVLTSFGQKIIVLGGEDSLNRIEDSSISYILDTSKIRYPPEISIPNLGSSPMIKSGSLLAPSPLSPMPQKALSMTSSKLNQESKSPLDVIAPSKSLQHSESLRTHMQTMSLEQFHKQRISRKHNRSKDFSFSFKEESNTLHHSNSMNNLQISRSQSQDQIKKVIVSDMKLNTSQTNTNNQNETKPAPVVDKNQIEVIEITKEKNLNTDDSQANNKDIQHSKFKENMDELKVKNELLQAELDLIKNPDLAKSSTEVFFDSIERQNMIENLISLKKQITLLKLEILSQTKAASLKIAEAEAEKNNCLQEAAYYKAKLAALSTPEMLSTVENARISELSTKLSNTIASRQELNERLASLSEDIDLEQRKVQQLEDMNQNYLKRIKVAESAHERISTELNETRLACIDAEEKIKEQVSLKNNLECEKNQLNQENITLKQELDDLKEKNMLYLKSIEMINISVSMAENRITNSENKSQKDQEARVELQNKVNQLTRELMLESNKKQALEEKIANLESKILNITKEANVAREIMNEGILELLKKSREASSINSSNDNQVKMLQEQLSSIKSLYSALQVSANKSVKDLVAALEKISQLETLNFSSNREIQDLRDKIIDLLKELDALKKDHRNMKNLLITKDKDLEIAHMKASAISRLLEEYPLLEEQKISKNDAISCVTRGTSMTCDTLDKNDFEKIKEEIEQDNDIKQEIRESHDLNDSSLEDTANKIISCQDMENNSKSSKDTDPDNMPSINPEKEALDLERQKVIDAERRLAESAQNFKERLQQLEGDYQSAVFYMKSTENMLKRMKEELSKYKIQNFHLKQENDSLKNYRNAIILNLKDHKINDDEIQNNSLSDDYTEIQAHQDILLQEKELESLEEKYINLKNTYYDNNKESADIIFPELEKTIDLETISSNKNLVFENLSNDQLIFSDKISEDKNIIPNLEDLNNTNNFIIDSMENDSIFLNESERLIPIDHYNIHETISSNSDNTSKNTVKKSILSRTSDTLDSLANELDQLRTQWESTHKDYETLLSD
ncbi:hypothetical protein T552_00838 [Pneumocystis carinii B80]|uniref:Uncharacterized protein n=1 Tax=Pneumocystis carinii (strain B80) TaxID=1408658 RepID=A0A0W4ZPS4_PNEC8|nr:hypothetical protein T552_00838 [Pneumocystis carinii B80]KTW30365.1 hypothetical protein T552_00838 [Pneumocystis carinii B80]